MNGDASQQTHVDAQGRDSEFDFWDFVVCSQCRLAFNGNGQPSVPFWITECGHVICNSHLNADQSCPTCKAPNIELMPLQKDLPAPMSDWFSHVPYRIDSLAQAARFQMESLASSVKYYKTLAAQYRSVCERLKGDVMAAKHLRKENEALRNKLNVQGANHNLNVNGKRPRGNLSNGSYSSPRSIHTPLGPTRITLPPAQEPPQLVAVPKTQQDDESFQQRPGSSLFAKQYAYNPPQSAQVPLQHNQALPHAQRAPLKFLTKDQRAMPPPPTPSRSHQMRLPNGPTSSAGPSRMSTSQGGYSLDYMQQEIPQQDTFGLQQHQPRMNGTSSSYGSSESASRMPVENGRRFAPPAPIASGNIASKRIMTSTSSGPPANATPRFDHAQARRFVPSAQGNPSVNVFNNSGGNAASGTQQQQRGFQRQRTAFFSNSRAGFKSELPL